MLYRHGSTLYVRGTQGAGRALRRLPGPDVFAPPIGTWLAYLVPGSPPGPDSDFVAAPRLRLWDTASGAELAAGPGADPLWDHSGTRLAYLRPVGQRVCEGESCYGDVAVASLTVPSGRRTTLLPRGNWVPLAWVGDHLLVADRGDPRHVVSVAPGGDARRIALRPSQVWDGSPDGRWLITAGRHGAAAVPMAGGVPSGSPTDIPLRPGTVLADGAFANASTRVAAIALDIVRPKRSRVVVFDPAAPRPRALPGSAGAATGVLWSGNDATVVTAVQAGRHLRAVACPANGSAACAPLLQWVRGVELLRAGP